MCQHAEMGPFGPPASRERLQINVHNFARALYTAFTDYVRKVSRSGPFSGKTGLIRPGLALKGPEMPPYGHNL